MGHANGQLHPVHLCFGYGLQLYAWFVGKGSGQRRDLQMISPAFSTLIGGMIGFLSGIKLMQNEDKKEPKC